MRRPHDERSDRHDHQTDDQPTHADAQHPEGHDVGDVGGQEGGETGDEQVGRHHQQHVADERQHQADHEGAAGRVARRVELKGGQDQDDHGQGLEDVLRGLRLGPHRDPVADGRRRGQGQQQEGRGGHGTT